MKKFHIAIGVSDIYPSPFKNPDLWGGLRNELQGTNRRHARWHGEDL